MMNFESAVSYMPYQSPGRVRDKCGVVGVFGFNGTDPDLLSIAYSALYGVQHRGQEAAGLASIRNGEFTVRRKQGLIRDVFTQQDLVDLIGYSTIGQTRYSTFGGNKIEHAQPIYFPGSEIALGHNGNLAYVKELRAFLESVGINTDRLNDSGMMHQAINFYRSKGMSLEEAIINAYPLFNGSFSATVIDKDTMIAFRDHHGFRPLSMRQFDGGVAFASESSALDLEVFDPGNESLNGQIIEDVKPGEMVIVNKERIRKVQIAEPDPTICSYELFYLARPDSYIEGQLVYQMRENAGIALAREYPLDVDMVVPILDSAMPAAIGYANALGVPLSTAIHRNKFVGRTFISPLQGNRESLMPLKLNPIEEMLRNKRVAVVDDSLIRATSSRWYMKRLEEIKVTEAHQLIASPPIIQRNLTGIDTPDESLLIASYMSMEQIREHIGATSLHYLSVDGFIEATGLPRERIDLTCHTGGQILDPERSTAKMLVAA